MQCCMHRCNARTRCRACTHARMHATQGSTTQRTHIRNATYACNTTHRTYTHNTTQARQRNARTHTQRNVRMQHNTPHVHTQHNAGKVTQRTHTYACKQRNAAQRPRNGNATAIQRQRNANAFGNVAQLLRAVYGMTIACPYRCQWAVMWT